MISNLGNTRVQKETFDGDERKVLEQLNLKIEKARHAVKIPAIRQIRSNKDSNK